jgi:hypothetical protein
LIEIDVRKTVKTSLVPLIPFYMSGKSCREGTSALVKLLREGIEGQEAAFKRADELKNLKPTSLIDLFALESKGPVASPKEELPKASADKKIRPEEAEHSQSKGTRKRTKKADEREALKLS